MSEKKPAWVEWASGLAEDDTLQEIDVFLPAAMLAERVLAMEGRWEPSGYKDWMIRIDRDVNDPERRHAHLARKKHLNTNTRQVAWNQDGSRHDAKRFHEPFGKIKGVREVVKQALEIASKIDLQDEMSGDYEVKAKTHVLEDGTQAYVRFV